VHEEDEDAWRKRRLSEHLLACEAAYRAGNPAAITAAVTWCEIYDCAPGPWLCEAIAKLVDLRTTDAERRERREAMLHYDRYDRVQELLEREFEKRGDARRRPLAEIYLQVGEEFGVSDKVVERSCLTVRKDTDAGHGAKYYLPIGRRL
jgi:hypothetical protein